MPPLLEVQQFTVHRAPGWQVHVPHLTLVDGAALSLHGPSGCGKSTVLHALFGQNDASLEVTGQVCWRGSDLRRAGVAERRRWLRHEVAFLMQDASSALDPLLPVGRQIELATGCSEAGAVTMLERLGLATPAGMCARLPHQISGGQAQCVLLAIAFLREPALVVADEPSASLDADSYESQLEHLRRLMADGCAVLLATHDQRLLRDLGAEVLSIEAGSFVPGLPLSPVWPHRTGGVPLGSMAVLKATGVTVASGRSTVLRDIDFVVNRGEIVAITGASGAGKTTLGRVLAGYRRPEKGIVVGPTRRGAVQLVCQDAFGSLTPGRSIAAQLAEASSPLVDLPQLASDLRLDPAVLARAAEALSGGERRRAALLRALAVHPDVLVLDEPTASLDRATSLDLVELLLALRQQRGIAIVVITHDFDLAHAIADRVVTVAGGHLCEA